MTQTQATYAGTPKVDALDMLLKVFSAEQLILLARRCQAMSAQGFGEITVVFNNGHPRFLQWQESEEFPK